MIGGFQSILFHGLLIAHVQIFKLRLTTAKNATVGVDLNVRFRMLLKGAVTKILHNLHGLLDFSRHVTVTVIFSENLKL